MSLGFRVTLIMVAIFGFAFFILSTTVADEMRYRYLEGVEESLVDNVNTLAEVVSIEAKRASGDPQRVREVLGKLFDRSASRRFDAHIYKYRKIRVDTSIYVTDSHGVVIFDSLKPGNVGRDFSTQRDVALTLKGRYGARFRRTGHSRHYSSVLYIAAPVFVDGALWGVVTLRKPTTGIDLFLRASREQLRWFFITMTLFVTLSVLLAVFFLTRPLTKLTAYARAVRDGQNPALPGTRDTQMRDLGEALAQMREALEGKRYVEEYVTNLTHELKSPVAAIQSAAELLTEELPPDKRALFTENILRDTGRIRALTERMLELARLEHVGGLERPLPVDLVALLTEVMERVRPMAQARSVSFFSELSGEFMVSGDPLLLSELFVNLLNNAVEFSPEAGEVTVACSREGSLTHVVVTDQGEGIPDYALPRIFDRFYSLKRPATGRRSSGIGLNFARTIVTLHGGTLEVSNGDAGGARAVVSFPSL